MPAAKLNMTIEQGTTWSKGLELTSPDGSALDITGHSFRGQMRAAFASADPAATFACGIVEAAAGTVSIALDENTTTGIQAGTYVYDIEMVSPDGSVIRLMEGKIQVTPEVTR